MHFDIQWHDRLDSTNGFLKDAFARQPDLPVGTVVAAREQTAGRGRHQRRWLSRPGRDLCFSLLLAPSASPARTPALTMAVALAVDDALRARGVPSRPKWPNDLLAGRCKIAGILSETQSAGTPARLGLIVGIGINVNMTAEEAAAIDRPATSLRIETGRDHPVEAVLQDVLSALPPWLDAWQRDGFDGLRAAWELRTGLMGKPVVLTDGEQTLTGTAEGFGTSGELLLRLPDGALRTCWAGDLSLVL